METVENRLYRTTCILMELSEYTGRIFSDKSFETVPVFDSDSKHIGFCTLKVQNKLLLGDISIDYNTPERLLAETKDFPLFARAVGKRVDSPYLEIYPKAIIVEKVVITTEKPTDSKKIEPFGELVLV